MGEWLTTLHSALAAQEPSQGFLHLLFTHARCPEHSSLLLHSGLQYGDCPWKPSKHVHDGASLVSLHIEFGPHGDGKHGFVGSGSFSAAK